METCLLFSGITTFFCFVFVVILVLLIAHAYRKRCLLLEARNMDFSIRSFVMLRLESGIDRLLPLARIFLRNVQIARLTDKARELMQSKGVDATNASLLSLFIGLLVIIAGFVLLLTRSIIAAFAVIACVIAAVVVGVGSASDRLQNEFREEIPVVLELMITCFGSGFTLLQTFQQIAKEIDGQLGRIFAQGAHVLETGGSVAEALGLLKERTDVSELTFVVAALEVQHQNGGALAPVLTNAAESVKGELSLKQTLRVQTAQAKLSARVVIVMPFVLIALFSLISPNFMAPFFSSVVGYVLFAIAILMEMAGIVLVKRSLMIGGLS